LRSKSRNKGFVSSDKKFVAQTEKPAVIKIPRPSITSTTCRNKDLHHIENTKNNDQSIEKYGV